MSFNNNRRRGGFRGGGGGGGYGGQHRGPPVEEPRRTEAEETENRLHSLILRIGEKSNSSLESNLEVLAEVLDSEFNAHKAHILATLGACVTEMPHKTCIYSTLCGLMNAKKYDFGQLFLEYVCNVLFKDILEDCEFAKARITTRFLADLVNTNVVLPHALLALFEQFVTVTGEMDIPQERSDHFVEMVLDSLPWVGRELAQTKNTELSRLMTQIGRYMDRRKKDYTACLNVWVEDSANALPQEENLDALWKMVKNMERRDWQEDAILRPYRAFESELSVALQHTLPPITIPPHKPGQSVYPLPQVLFRLWDPADVPQSEPALPSSDRIERYIIEEQIRGILTMHEPNRRDCVKYLMSIPNYKRFPMEFMIVEVILGELFHLPAPQFRLIYYGVMLLELSKVPDTGFANILAMAIEMLCDRVDSMDVECVQRFSEWFAWHLSNNDFKWNWQDWAEVLQASEDDPRVLFVKESLGKCIRLSYHERIRRTLTEEMQQMLAPDVKPHFKYDPALGHEFADVAKEVVDAIRQKLPDEAILTVLNKVDGGDTTMDDGEGEKGRVAVQKVSVLVESLLYASSKSYSHIISAIERYLKALQELTRTDEGRYQAVLSVFEYWEEHQQMIIILMDKLMTYRVVDNRAIINCLFSEHLQRFFLRDYVWEVLCNMLNKMNERTNQVRATLAKEEAALQELANPSENKMEEDDQASKVGTLEQRVGQLRATLDNVVLEQREAFVSVFQCFINVLTDSLRQSEMDGSDATRNPWFRVTINRMKQIGRLYHKEISQFIVTMEGVLFTSETPREIKNTFKEFRCLHK